jgi:hypothetical protein
VRLFGTYQIPKILVDGFKGPGLAGSPIVARGADLTGDADGKTGVLSFWFRITTPTSNQIIVANGTTVGGATPHFQVRYEASAVNKIKVTGFNAAGTGILVLTANTGFTSGWHHTLASWDLAAGVAHLYSDGVQDLAAGSTLTNDTIDYAAADWGVCGGPGGAAPIESSTMAELFFTPNQFLDLSVVANRNKFRSAIDGKPVALGADGSVPLGVAPLIYLHLNDGEAVANFSTNRGNGGGFTRSGSAFTADASSPSD